MAHDIHVKARACAAMMCGARVREVARDMNLPVSTVSRWRQEEVVPRMREIRKRMQLRANFARPSIQNGTQKRG